MKKAILLAAAAAFVSTPAMAAPGDTATATGAATAEVVAPITLTHVAGAALDFGTFTAGAGTVVVDQAGNGSFTGDSAHVTTSTEAADAFTVGGDGSRTFTITTTGGTVSETGGATMSFTTDAPASGSLNATGAASFNVGGTLTVSATQTAGSYSGTYSATVTYN